MRPQPLRETLLDWYARHGRRLPWRETRDPYRIWVSEIILQQTRIAQGTDYYLRFVERFPDIASLAAASEDQVLKQWQGLGYYSRARNLHRAAQLLAEQFDGQFPRSYHQVRSLPGIGDYTAAAICSIAAQRRRNLATAPSMTSSAASGVLVTQAFSAPMRVMERRFSTIRMSHCAS